MQKIICPVCQGSSSITHDGLLDYHLTLRGIGCAEIGSKITDPTDSRPVCADEERLDWDAYIPPPPPKCSGTIRGGH